MKIEELRSKIGKIDNKILVLMAQRLRVSREIANYKKKNNLPIRDLKREKEIKSEYYLKLKNLGFNDKKFINKLFGVIINKSILVQKEKNNGK